MAVVHRAMSNVAGGSQEHVGRHRSSCFKATGHDHEQASRITTVFSKAVAMSHERQHRSSTRSQVDRMMTDGWHDMQRHGTADTIHSILEGVGTARTLSYQPAVHVVHTDLNQVAFAALLQQKLAEIEALALQGWRAKCDGGGAAEPISPEDTRTSFRRQVSKDVGCRTPGQTAVRVVQGALVRDDGLDQKAKLTARSQAEPPSPRGVQGVQNSAEDVKLPCEGKQSEHEDGSHSQGPRISEGTCTSDSARHVQFRDHSSAKSSDASAVPSARTRTKNKKSAMLDSIIKHLNADGSIEIESKESCLSRLRPSNMLHLHQMVIDEFPGWSFFLESFSSLVILANVATIGISADYSPTWKGWIAIDILFTCLFTLETASKVWLSKRLFCSGKERWWNLFEVVLVLLSWSEVFSSLIELGKDLSGYAVLRILRLTRITRLLRVCRLSIFGELKIMLAGAYGGLHTLVWSAVICILPIYAASILFTETLGMRASEGHGAEAFATVAQSFYTLFRCTVSQDCADQAGLPLISQVARYHGWVYSLIFCVMEFFVTFGLFNVMNAIFNENVLSGARTNETILTRERIRDKSFFANKIEFLALLHQVVQELQGSENVLPGSAMELIDEVLLYQITPDIMDLLMSHPRTSQILHDLNVQEDDVVNLFDALDLDGSGAIDIEELFDGITRLRGAPCRSDVVGLGFMMQQLQEDMLDQRMQSERALKFLVMLYGEVKGIALHREMPGGQNLAGRTSGTGVRFASEQEDKVCAREECVPLAALFGEGREI